MVSRAEVIEVSVPGVHAIRRFSDELYTGIKETYSVSRIETGRSQWWCGGKVWPCGPGTLLVKQPGDVHRDVSRDGLGTLQIISFQPESVERVIGKLRLQPQIARSDARGAVFHRLHDAVRARAGRLELEVAVTEAISAFGSIGDAKIEHTPAVRRAVELLREQLAQSVTLDDLAAHAALDKFHLCRAFRAQIGLPPHAYLTRLRIMRAKQLLDTGMRPSEVALQVGLYDQSQLNRHFRRIVGTTPGQYSRSHACAKS
jgi:AraC-like DNA-binding protein